MAPIQLAKPWRTRQEPETIRQFLREQIGSRRPRPDHLG